MPDRRGGSSPGQCKAHAGTAAKCRHQGQLCVVLVFLPAHVCWSLFFLVGCLGTEGSSTFMPSSLSFFFLSFFFLRTAKWQQI